MAETQPTGTGISFARDPLECMKYGMYETQFPTVYKGIWGILNRQEEPQAGVSLKGVSRLWSRARHCPFRSFKLLTHATSRFDLCLES